MLQLVLTLVLLIFSCSNVSAKCIVNQDCVFEFPTVLIADGYSRDATGTLTLVGGDKINLRYVFSDDSGISIIAEGSQSDTCPPPNSGACMVVNGNGWYRITIDSLLIPSVKAGTRLCLDILDNQVTRTIPDMAICQDVEEGGTVWATYEIVDLTNDGGDQNSTTTSADTNLVWAANFTSTVPQPIMYYPTVSEDSRQSVSCNLQGFRTEITAYNTATKVITFNTVPEAPNYQCLFRIY